MKQILLLLFVPVTMFSQITFSTNGAPDQVEMTYALTHATVFGPNGMTLNDATIVIKGKEIVEVGTSVEIPEGAFVKDLSGKYVYPGFVELISDYGINTPKASNSSPYSGKPQYDSNRKGPYAWNEALKTDFDAAEHFTLDQKAEEEYLQGGYTTIVTHRKDGISRGTSTLVALLQDKENEAIIKPQVAHHLSFSKGSSKQMYPTSLMGVIALLRQTYYDAKWYNAGGVSEERNITLERWQQLSSLPTIISVGDKLEVLRAGKVAKEFNKTYIIQEDGTSYQRADLIAALGMPLILPLKMPEAIDVTDPVKAEMAEYATLKHWEMAPANASILDKKNVRFAFTSDGLKKPSESIEALQKAVQFGLDKKKAVLAMTEVPASLTNTSGLVGSIQRGKLASFIITDKDLFEKGVKIEEVWSMGEMKSYSSSASSTLTEAMQISTDNGQTYRLMQEKGKTKLVSGRDTLDATFGQNRGRLSLSFKKDSITTYMSGYKLSDEKWAGHFYDQKGDQISWTATSLASPESSSTTEEDKNENTAAVEMGSMVYPFAPYGWEEMPTAQTFLIKNATLWTNEEQGVISGADILIKSGKINKIGSDLSAPSDAVVIDAEGKHVTPGIIDEHSHIAASRGINEAGQASSAEVRIGDIIDSEDITIYRQLAGGVTTAQILHGSANPIGGQSQIIKLRWGKDPESMKLENAPKFIKFALGENVKQSNWGSDVKDRFPQTRMGVEQVYKDFFTRAKEYKTSPPARRDLELETLGEILDGKRNITCHSYQQGEINMLMNLADKMGFKVNTFTHILEGYKVADKMAARGIAGSTFSDWWAYKYEVIDAIPYNGAIMHNEGILTAFNSDDDELARRLNQEAGKAVKYGNVPPEEALKFVTINPAKMLHIDDRVGSLKEGKDADIVVWSGDPLSVYSRAEKTFVDGVLYFDRETDLEKRAAVKEEKQRLIQKLIAHKNGGGTVQKPKPKMKHKYHCDTLHDEGK